MDFATTLDSIMKERGYSKYRVAKILGVSQTTVANWLAGKTAPYAKEWDRIAHALGVSPADLFTGAETKIAPAPKDERIAAMEGRIAMLVDLFERLPPDDQNDVLYQLLAKAHDQLDREKRKGSE